MSVHHSSHFLDCISQVAETIDYDLVDKMADELVALRARGGRLFILGVGGSAANASHAVNDFRKLCNIEAYAPTDNVAELTARTNDEGWDSVFIEWLQVSRANEKDAIFVLSVGGGNSEKNISANIVMAASWAWVNKVPILGIVGRDGGYTGARATCAIIIPTVDKNLVTPLTESFQSVILHCLVSHPKLQVNKTKW